MNYNIECKLSGLSIEKGDPIVVFLLIRNHYLPVGDGHALNPAGGCYASFTPMCLPIMGTYDGEGGLVVDRNDTTVSSICSLYDIDSLKEFWEQVSGEHPYDDTRTQPNMVENLGTISTMFVHRSLYDGMVSAAPNKYEETRSIERFNESTMKALGFVLVSKNESEKYGGIEWALPDGLTVHTDCSPLAEGSYNVRTKGKLISEIKRLEQVIKRNFSHMSQYPFGYFYIKHQLDNWLADHKVIPNHYREQASSAHGMTGHMSRFNPMGRLYRIEDDYDFLLENWVKFKGFIFMFSRTGGRFEPSYRRSLGSGYSREHAKKQAMVLEFLETKNQNFDEDEVDG